MNSENSIFSADEVDLLNAARMVLSDGVQRLKGRENLLPTNRSKRVDRKECREAREALTDKLIADYGNLRYEVAVVILIDAQGRLIDIRPFPQGKATHCEISPRILAGFILECGASAVLLAHNHPSGEATPSQADVDFTMNIGPWLHAMDVDLLDHLVLNGAEASAIMGTWL